MIKFKNVSGFPLSLFHPSGPDSFVVDVDETVSIPGTIDFEDDDKVVIDGKAYSKKVWELVIEKGKK